MSNINAAIKLNVAEEIQDSAIEVSEQIIQDYKILSEKIDQTLVKIKKNRKSKK